MKFLLEVCLMRYNDLRKDYKKVFEGTNIDSRKYLASGWFENGDAGSDTRIYGVEMSVDEMIEFLKQRVELEETHDCWLDLVDLNDGDDLWRFEEDENCFEAFNEFLDGEQQDQEVIRGITKTIDAVCTEKGIGFGYELINFFKLAAGIDIDD